MTKYVPVKDKEIHHIIHIEKGSIRLLVVEVRRILKNVFWINNTYIEHYNGYMWGLFQCLSSKFHVLSSSTLSIMFVVAIDWTMLVSRDNEI